ncbi:MAG: VWA domain-containing protein [Saprospiraceae bacterium]|nr:VWA domain-containing protein [Saprospiraceae bacterium]MCB0679897.1 VWA domain-containing protein [Saprospiraceae bacterium]
MTGLIEHFRFAAPAFLLLLLLLPVFFVWYRRKGRRQQVAFKFSSLQPLEGLHSWRGRLREWLPVLRALAFVALVVALARPQEILKRESIKAEGIDIMLVMDLSNSMLARDFQPDRLEASKVVAKNFVAKRPYDRIGLTLFAGEAFTQCPLTTDHRVLQDFLDQLSVEIFEEQGTAIGMGLASAVNWLKESDSESKIAILLTDGVNTTGYIPPPTAAELAKEFDIRVYTIGVGSNGYAPMPFSRLGNGQYQYKNVKVEIDEKLLNQIAQTTGGKYYRAASQQQLESIYDEIDRLEKSEIEVTVLQSYGERFHPFALAALLLLALEMALRYVALRSLP